MLGSYVFLPCFTLVAIVCVLVQCFHSWGKGILLGGLNKGNAPFTFILNTFHLHSSCCPIFDKWLLHVHQKRSVPSSSYEKGIECLRLMQLVEEWKMEWDEKLKSKSKVQF
jgi:hypothetical protein